jgi:hypothetical protein
VVAAVSVGVVLVVSAGTAFAAYRYDASTSDRILPGVRIAGVDVGGMRRDEAVRTLREKAEETLYGDLVVRAAGRSWTVTPASLGMTADVEGAGVAGVRAWPTRCRSRRACTTGCATSRSTRPWICRSSRIAAASRRSSSRPSTRSRCRPSTRGSRWWTASSSTSRSHEGAGARGARRDGADPARAVRPHGQGLGPVRTLDPKVTTASLGASIVVDLSENELYLYDGLHVVKQYPCRHRGAPGTRRPWGTGRS